MRPRAKKSFVWKYFSKADNQVAVCLFCEKNFKYFGGTTNLHFSVSVSTIQRR